MHLPTATAVLLAALFGVAAAQTRSLPEQAQTGRLSVGLFPEARLDGRPVRLGAGARILDESNRIVMPSTVQGEKRVAFTRGPGGEIARVWILTSDEQRSLAERKARAAARGSTQPLAND